MLRFLALTVKNLQPQEVLYKKHIVIVRGCFRPVINVHLDMLHTGVKQILEEPAVDKENIVVLAELIYNLERT